MRATRKLVVAFWCVSATCGASQPFYHPDSQHLWNRLSESLFTRIAPDTGEKYGSNELDILFWNSTSHLLTSPSHERAIRALDEFIDRHGERQIRDPLKRIILQRDLWELFDWSATSGAGIPEAKAELQRRVAIVIRRLALSQDELGHLPDNYALGEGLGNAPGFPRGLFAANGDWVLVGKRFDPTASEHTSGFGGRSVFLVFVSLPGGRAQTLKYLQTLRAFEPALIYASEGRQARHEPALFTNPATPQFPGGTRWALVRMLCAIDNRGQIVATRLVESIQTRTYVDPAAGQQVFEFRLDRSHAPQLRVVPEGERNFHFVQFRSPGSDPFETENAEEWARDRNQIRAETLRTCIACHAFPGILSVNTYSVFGREANPLDESTVERETQMTRAWKSQRFEWGLLQGLWRH